VLAGSGDSGGLATDIEAIGTDGDNCVLHAVERVSSWRWLERTAAETCRRGRAVNRSRGGDDRAKVLRSSRNGLECHLGVRRRHDDCAQGGERSSGTQRCNQKGARRAMRKPVQSRCRTSRKRLRHLRWDRPGGTAPAGDGHRHIKKWKPDGRAAALIADVSNRKQEPATEFRALISFSMLADWLRPESARDFADGIGRW